MAGPTPPLNPPGMLTPTQSQLLDQLERDLTTATSLVNDVASWARAEVLSLFTAVQEPQDQYFTDLAAAAQYEIDTLQQLIDTSVGPVRDIADKELAYAEGLLADLEPTAGIQLGSDSTTTTVSDTVACNPWWTPSYVDPGDTGITAAPGPFGGPGTEYMSGVPDRIYTSRDDVLAALPAGIQGGWVGPSALGNFAWFVPPCTQVGGQGAGIDLETDVPPPCIVAIRGDSCLTQAAVCAALAAQCGSQPGTIAPVATSPIPTEPPPIGTPPIGCPPQEPCPPCDTSPVSCPPTTVTCPAPVVTVQVTDQGGGSVSAGCPGGDQAWLTTDCSDVWVQQLLTLYPDLLAVAWLDGPADATINDIMGRIHASAPRQFQPGSGSDRTS